MNTKIEYLYRDASNYKKWNEAIIPGIFTDEQKEKIKKSLIDGEYFYPEMVGLPYEKFGGSYDDDPDWFEFCDPNFEMTENVPTVDITPQRLTDMFTIMASIKCEANTSCYKSKNVQPAVNVYIYNGVIYSVMTNVPGLDVTIIDFDENIGSDNYELEKDIVIAKSAGMKETSYFIGQCIPDGYDGEE